MTLRSGGRKLSFEILTDEISGDGMTSGARRRRRSKSSRKKASSASLVPSAVLTENGFHVEEEEEVIEQRSDFVILENRSMVETLCESRVEEESTWLNGSCVTHVELRQRNVNGNGEQSVVEDAGSRTKTEVGGSPAPSDPPAWRKEMNGKLMEEKSLDWNEVLAEDPSILGEASTVDKSPFKYFIGEMYGGSSLRRTITAGNEKKRQGVYNTMFHVPWRCERVVVAGFFVCLDSFLSLLTIMPARILMTVWRLLKTRQFLRPNAAELSDYGCFIVLALGVASLQRIDISLIYHVIRGQGTIKLYVVYNVLEIFDKLCQSFGEDVLQVLFNSAEGLSSCSSDNAISELMRFILDEVITVVAFVVHSFVLLAQGITLSTCIIAPNNSLLALLVSNNFAEIKSNLFKRASKENLHNLLYFDIIERFHITTCLVFVLAQNILEAEGSWFENFIVNALLVYFCEIFVDSIKHSFLAKFNEIKPVVYSEFLEDLCRQVLNEKPDERQQDLPFIPLAPACVVIRVIAPIYNTVLPHGPFLWRLFWIILWSSLTFFMLAICKILVGLVLQRLAIWYLTRRLAMKQHAD